MPILSALVTVHRAYKERKDHFVNSEKTKQNFEVLKYSLNQRENTKRDAALKKSWKSFYQKYISSPVYSIILYNSNRILNEDHILSSNVRFDAKKYFEANYRQDTSISLHVFNSVLKAKNKFKSQLTLGSQVNPSETTCIATNTDIDDPCSIKNMKEKGTLFEKGGKNDDDEKEEEEKENEKEEEVEEVEEDAEEKKDDKNKWTTIAKTVSIIKSMNKIESDDGADLLLATVSDNKPQEDFSVGSNVEEKLFTGMSSIESLKPSKEKSVAKGVFKSLTGLMTFPETDRFEPNDETMDIQRLKGCRYALTFAAEVANFCIQNKGSSKFLYTYRSSNNFGILSVLQDPNVNKVLIIYIALYYIREDWESQTPQDLLDTRNKLFKIFADVDQSISFFESVNTVRLTIFSKYIAQLVYDRKIPMNIFEDRDFFILNEIKNDDDEEKQEFQDELDGVEHQLRDSNKTATQEYKDYITRTELNERSVNVVQEDPIRFLQNFCDFINHRDYLEKVSGSGYNCYTSALLFPEENSEKAYLCFITQMVMYYGATFYTEVQHGVPDLEKIPVITCVLILFFTFLYTLNVMTSEFYLNTFLTFDETRSRKQKLFVFLNFLVNVFSTLCICYATANILKVSQNYVDIILNSVAIFFVCELDDILMTDVEVEILNERKLTEYVKLSIQYATKNKLRSDYNALEILFLYFMTICNILIFLIAILHFAGFEDLETYGMNDSWYIFFDKVI